MIRPATLAELRARGADLFAAAGKETGIDGGAIQWGLLESYEDAGALLLLAVEVDGELVGYCCSALILELWLDATTCITLSVYVQPRHRGRWGLRLLRDLAEAAAARGAGLHVHAIPGSRLDRLLARRGLTPLAVAYEAGFMHYTAHGSGQCDHRGPRSRLRRVFGRASVHRPEEGRP